MHRVYDKVDKKWIKDEIYISTYGDLYVSKKTILNKLGFAKLKMVSDKKNIVQNAVGVRDKNGVAIFEGDICKCETKDGDFIYCAVGFAPERAAYLFFDYKNNLFYPILEVDHEKIEIVGNTLDNPELVTDNGGVLFKD